MEKDKISFLKKHKKYLFIVIILTLFSAAALLKPAECVILNYDGEYIRSQIFFSGFGFLILNESKEVYETQVDASTQSAGINPRIRLHSSIAEIYFSGVGGNEVYNSNRKKPDIHVRYLGRYKINLSGHIGTLTIRQKNGWLYGGVQFPGWAKGSYEPLKKMRLKGNTIYFTRSVSTPDEIRKTGSPGYFTQTFSGKYSSNGDEITGFFSNRGAKQSWTAERYKK